MRPPPGGRRAAGPAGGQRTRLRPAPSSAGLPSWTDRYEPLAAGSASTVVAGGISECSTTGGVGLRNDAVGLRNDAGPGAGRMRRGSARGVPAGGTSAPRPRHRRADRSGSTPSRPAWPTAAPTATPTAALLRRPHRPGGHALGRPRCWWTPVTPPSPRGSCSTACGSPTSPAGCSTHCGPGRSSSTWAPTSGTSPCWAGSSSAPQGKVVAVEAHPRPGRAAAAQRHHQRALRLRHHVAPRRLVERHRR